MPGKTRSPSLGCLNCRACWRVPEQDGTYVCGKSHGRIVYVIRWGKETREHGWFCTSKKGGCVER